MNPARFAAMAAVLSIVPAATAAISLPFFDDFDDGSTVDAPTSGLNLAVGGGADAGTTLTLEESGGSLNFTDTSNSGNLTATGQFDPRNDVVLTANITTTAVNKAALRVRSGTTDAAFIQLINNQKTVSVFHEDAGGTDTTTSFTNQFVDGTPFDVSLRLDAAADTFEVLVGGSSLGSFPLRNGVASIDRIQIDTLSGNSTFSVNSLEVTAIPEPASVGAVMAAGLLLTRRRSV